MPANNMATTRCLKMLHKDLLKKMLLKDNIHKLEKHENGKVIMNNLPASMFHMNSLLKSLEVQTT
jgi:hypothetical protein